MHRTKRPAWSALALGLGALALVAGPAAHPVLAKDYYVSAKRGKGKKGTKEKPAKDLGNIIKKLQPGDVIHIAGGTYVGRAKNGSNLIKVPVQIFGGYDDAFTKRNPWGKTPTVLSGVNKSKNWVSLPGLFIDLSKYRGEAMPEIVVDGIIVDHAAAEADVKAQETKVNALRRMLGLPLLGGKLDVDTGTVWLHRLPLAEALRCANTPIAEGFGCRAPKN